MSLFVVVCIRSCIRSFGWPWGFKLRVLYHQAVSCERQVIWLIAPPSLAMDAHHDHPPVVSKFKSGSSNRILRGDPQLASTALHLARHVLLMGLRQGSDKQVGQVLELIKFAESACESPLLCPADMDDDNNFQDPRKYADSLVKLARDVDAHPWGAFGFVHPAKYLPFLQQLAGDLMVANRPLRRWR